MTAGSIIVTGASKGIGAAICADLDRRGFEVIGLSRSGTAPAGRAIACDMTDEAKLCAILAEIAAEGPVAGLVNNAGLHIVTPSAELESAEYDRIMALNARAVMIACREIHRPLVAAGGGLIVNIGSFYEKLGIPGNLAYSAAKAAMGAMTRCLAVEWAADNIRVLDVAPGYVATDLNRDFIAKKKVQAWFRRKVPMGRPGTAEEVARFVGVLFAEDIPYLTGETIHLDGGHGIDHS